MNIIIPRLSFHRTTKTFHNLKNTVQPHPHLIKVNNFLKVMMTGILLYGFSHIYHEKEAEH